MCVLFFCVNLWEIGRTHSMRWHTNNLLGSFISHRAHRVHWAFLRTVSSPQKASGIQSSQSVTAKEGCWVIVVRCWWLAIGVSRWLRPSLLGRGRGRGLYLYGPLCVLFICAFLWEKVRTLHEKWIVLYKRKNATSVRKRIVLCEKKNVWEPYGEVNTHRAHGFSCLNFMITCNVFSPITETIKQLVYLSTRQLVNLLILSEDNSKVVLCNS